jgi:hypothetical protein
MADSLGLPTTGKPPSEWTKDEALAVATLLMLAIKYLPDACLDEDATAGEIQAAASKTIAEWRMPDAFFFDEYVAFADRQRGGRIQ